MKSRALKKGIACLVLAASMLAGCHKEQISPAWEDRSLPLPIDCRDILMTDAQSGFVAGGTTWNNGYIASTLDGGMHWQLDSISPWHLYAVYCLPDGAAFASGFGGYMHERSVSASVWGMHGLPYWLAWNDIAFDSDNSGIVAGGQAYQGGKLVRLNANRQVVQVDTFVQEISAVAWSAPGIAHAAGYGIVLRSIDGGITWQNSGEKGDFFRSISFPTPETGYICGSSGSILKTTDSGASWQTIRKGKSLWKSDARFRAIFFENAEKGYIAGERGLLWRTIDGGDSWQIVDNLPDTDLYAVSAYDGSVWAAGAGGRIFYFRDL